MNQCVDAGSRLATWQELPVKGDGNVYWFGLYKKPWLWIDSGVLYLDCYFRIRIIKTYIFMSVELR